MAIILALGWLVGIPVATVNAVSVWTSSSAAIQLEMAQRTKVSAVLLTDSPTVLGAGRVAPAAGTYDVSARWTAPDGTAHDGTLTTPLKLVAGDQLPLWVDRSGAITGPPRAASDAMALAVLAALSGYAFWGSMLYGAFVLVRRRLNQHRIAGWATEWADLGPTWKRNL